MNKLTYDLIQSRMKEIGLTPVNIIKKSGLSKQNVYNWVNAKATPKGDDYRKFLHILRLTIDIDGEIVPVDKLTNSNFDEAKNIEKIKYVPILSYVQAGEFTDLSNLNSDELEHIPLPASEVPKNAFLLRVKGDSMVYDYSSSQRLKMEYSRFSINENECVLIDTNQTNIDCLIGKVVVAHNGQGTTVKLAYEEEQGICLMPLNSRLQNNENIKRPDTARIIGKVIDVINKRSFR